MDIKEAIKISLRKICIEPEQTHTEIIKEISPSLHIKEKEKKYYKKTIKLDIHPIYYTNGFEKTLKENIIRLTKYNDCWVKKTGDNVFHILV